jgi:hypothetical protein
MKYSSFLPFVLFLLFFSNSSNSFGQLAAPPKHVVEEIENGQIDWTSQFIEVHGKSYIDKSIEPYERAVDLATLAAKQVARINLLEAFGQIRVTRGTRVEDLMKTKDEISSYIEGTIKRSRMIGKPVVTEISIEVTIRIPLYNNGITDEIIKRTSAIKPAEIDNVELPEPYTQNDKIRKSETVPSLVLPVGDSSALALRFPDGQITQSLFPVIVDESGNIVVDMATQYAKYKNKYGKYVDVAAQILEAAKANKALEFVNAVQDSDGVIHINTNKEPKLQKILKKIKSVGSFALPFILALI